MITVCYKVNHERFKEAELSTLDKKEAEAYDKMLDRAFNVLEFIENSNKDIIKTIPENELEKLCLFLSENNDVVSNLLKGKK